LTPTTLSHAELVAELLATSSLPTAADAPRVSDCEPTDGHATASAALLTRKLDVARELLMRDLQAQMRRGPIMDSPQTLRDWLRLHCAGLEHEVFLVLYLDVGHRLIDAEQLFRGTLTQTSVYPREVVKGALSRNCSAVAVAHNHPSSGSPEPSRADEHLTQSLRSALALVDVRVIDHFVVSGDQIVSMAERGLV
jgi:DNA repair protein RadC